METFSLADTHAHLTDAFEEIDSLILRAQENKILRIINICTTSDSLKKALLYQQKYPSSFFNVAATSPHDVEKIGDKEFAFIQQQAEQKKLLAIGETGLDYYYEHSPKATQKKFFYDYLHLALKCQLPIVIHCREAFDDLFEILDAEFFSHKNHSHAILHCFSSDWEIAKKALQREMFISFSGIITFKKADTIKEVVKNIPLSHMLLETDAPYLTPHPYRGKKNEPSYLIYIAEAVAQIKNTTVTQIAHASWENTNRAFHLQH